MAAEPERKERKERKERSSFLTCEKIDWRLLAMGSGCLLSLKCRGEPRRFNNVITNPAAAAAAATSRRFDAGGD